MISLFQRKWRSLPQFQQTRGILRLLAQWVAEAFTDSYRKSHQDLLISLGTAPLEVLSFCGALVDQQLHEPRLDAVITTDIGGRLDAHADYLDRQAKEDIKKKRLHRKIATAIFFESNGGQTDARTSQPEIRLAVGEPDLYASKMIMRRDHSKPEASEVATFSPVAPIRLPKARRFSRLGASCDEREIPELTMVMQV